MLTSPSNPRVKDALRLYRRPHRNRTGLTLVEGFRQLSRALDAGVPVETLFYCRALWLGSSEDLLLLQAEDQGSTLVETAEVVFRKLSMRDRPDGLLGVARIPRRSLVDLEGRLALPGPPPLLVAVEAVEKPGNLGALLRSCDGAGVAAVLSCDPTTDLQNPNVVRASLGTLFTRIVVETTTIEALALSRRQGLRMVGASPEGETCFTDADLVGPLVIFLGSEQYGLSQPLRQAPDLQLLHIPMLGAADSLNLAQAGTLLVYEALRQRQAAAP